MMNSVSTAIARWLLREGVILDDDQEIFSYAAFCFLFGLLPVLIAIVLGAITGMLFESLLLILPFMLLRKFSGGFHLNSMIACIVVSTLVISAAIGLVSLIINFDLVGILSIMVLLSLVSICIFSPIDSPTKKISQKERTMFQWTARCITSVVALIFFLLILLNQRRIGIPIGVGVLMTAVLQWPCVISGSIRRVCRCELLCVPKNDN